MRNTKYIVVWLKYFGLLISCLLKCRYSVINTSCSSWYYEAALILSLRHLRHSLSIFRASRQRSCISLRVWSSHWGFKGPVIKAAFFFNIVALQVQKRCCTYYHLKHCHAILEVEAACCSNLNCLLIFSTSFFNLQQQNATCTTININ